MWNTLFCNIAERGLITVSHSRSLNMLPRYKDIVDLLKKGSTMEAQEQIMSLREGALELQ
jgi:hypothetical protein